MIEGHGDDSYKYRYPIRSNFSSNVYNKVNLDGTGTLYAGGPSGGPPRSACRFSLRDEWRYGSHLSDSADLSGNEHGHSDAYV